MFDSKTIIESYPPCFRQQSSGQINNKVTDNDDDRRNDHEEDDPLPVIDLGQIDLEKLEDACTNWGILRLVNHGIPLGLLSELHEKSVRVFELEFESKETLFASIPSSVMSYFWGTPALTSSGVALMYKGSDNDEKTVNYNWVEGLNVPQQPSHPQLHQTPLLHDFRILLEEYGVHQARIANLVFCAMSQNLKLSLENKCYLSPSTGLLRVYRYPRCFSDKSSKVWGIASHTDSSVVSILNQYEVGGLQILSEKDDAWIHVKPIPNTLVVHLGDMMQAISDDKYKSVKHRVMVNKEKERISIAYFAFPNNEYVIQSSKYKPFTYSDFRDQVQHDIKTLGVKVGLSRFRLDKDL